MQKSEKVKKNVREIKGDRQYPRVESTLSKFKKKEDQTVGILIGWYHE